MNGDGGFALKVVADLIQEAVVDEGTLRTVLLARIGLMSRQHQSTSDEVQLIAGPEEFGGGATELLPWKKADMLVGEVFVATRPQIVCAAVHQCHPWISNADTHSTNGGFITE